MLNTKLSVPSVGFSVAGLDQTKFGFYQFYCCHVNIGENFIAIGQEKNSLLRRLKNTGMASEKLYRNTLITTIVFRLLKEI